LVRDVLRPEQPFQLHQALHAAVFAGWDERVLGPAPIWVPTAADVAGTNVQAFMDRFEVGASHRLLRLQSICSQVAACGQ
jgi:hypothetical protein